GGLMPSAVGVVSDQFGRRRAQATGLFTSVFPIGGIIGPNLGGYILHQWGWRELFFINVPIGVLVLVGVQLLLTQPERVQGTPRAVAMVIVSTVASLFVIRLGYRAPMVGGMLLVVASLLLLGQGWTSLQLDGVTVGGFGLLAAIVALSGVGMGLAGPASNNAA